MYAPSVIKQKANKAEVIYSEPAINAIDQNENLSKEFERIFNDFKQNISKINNWTRDNIQKNIEEFLKIKKLKFPILGKSVRFLLINSYNGPSISDIFEILGKKDSIYRLNQYIDKN